MVVLEGLAVSYERSTPVVDQRAQRKVQGYLAHKKQPPPLESPQDPRHGPTAGS